MAESNLMAGGSCSLCRRPIDRDFFKHPQLHQSRMSNNDSCGTTSSDGTCWFYEGKNGWWKFDERNNEDLEKNFSQGLERVDFLICGNLYVSDFENMIQRRKDGCGKIRRIKRDDANLSSKGIAGLSTLTM